MRQRISLDGAWEFLHSGYGSGQPVRVREAIVPGPWQSQFADLRTRGGIGVYRREFELPPGWRNGRVYLRFGGVFHTSRVWLNGAPAGGNEGGFLPFELDVTELVVEGVNEVKVRAESPTDDPQAFPDAPLAEIPFGKQSWYGPLSGIWQTVSIESRSPEHVSDVRLRADLPTGNIAVRVLTNTRVSRPTSVIFEVRDAAGESVARAVAEGLPGMEEAARDILVPSPSAWSLDTPALYTLHVSLEQNGSEIDRVERPFGFRTFEARDGAFYLNGKPVYLRGALDQDYYPDTICTTPSLEYLEDQLRKAKELGLNLLRLHIKAPDPRYYDVADRLGILVWAELPNGGLSTERSRVRKDRLLKGIVDRDSHHPSIVIWTIINENWGVDLVHDASHRAWLRRTYRWLKDYDPTRLVVDNSALFPSFHVETDIADYHFYAAIPDSRAKWDEFVDALAGRESFLFSTEGDAAATGSEPLVCSEFGNWGLPDPHKLAGPDGREPWWFETGHDWGQGIMYPHGIEIRFHDWHLDRVFGSFERFIEATQWQQFRALRYQIERMRARPEIAGYVITEFTDVHWEANGLMDMRRNLRVFAGALAHVNADTLLVPQVERWSYWSAETIELPVAIAHAAGPEGAGARLVVGVEGCEPVVVEIPRLERVLRLDPIRIDLPRVSASRVLQVDLRLVREERTIGRGSLDLAIHPRLDHAGRPALSVWSPSAAILDHCRAIGLVAAERPADADLVVAAKHDPDLAGHVRQGGRLLLLAETEQPLTPLFPHWQNVKVEKRSGTPWQGDWASSFSWLVRSGPFAALPGGPLLDFAFDRVVPEHVVSGANLHDFHGRVHAGLVVGWIHRPVALAVERAYGDGSFLASTFRLFRDPPLSDPTAAILLDALARRAVNGRAAAGGERPAR